MKHCIRILYFSGKRRREARVLSHLADSGLIYLTEITKGDFLHAISSPVNFLTYLSYLRHIIRRFRPHLLFCENSGYSQLPALFLRLLFRIPLTFNYKGDIWESYQEIQLLASSRRKLAKLFQHLVSLLFIHFSNGIFPISYLFRTRLHNRLPNLLSKIPTPVVHPDFSPLQAAQFSQTPPLSLPCHPPFLLTVTNFKSFHKILPLASAVPLLVPYLLRSGITWYILGDGPFRSLFRHTIQPHIDSGLVTLPGWQDPTPYYIRAVAMLYFSGTDGLPNVVLESFYHRVPVIINTDCPALEYCTSSVALQINFHDPDHLERLFTTLQFHRGQLLGLADRAAQFLLEEFSLPVVAPRYYDAIAQVCKQSGVHTPS